jgi:Ca-activated chloride channel family protein
MTNKHWTIARIGLLVVMVLALTHVSRAQFQGGRGVNPRDAQQQAAQPAVVVSTEPPPLETDLVLLTVSVTPPENNSRPTLTRDHFQVFEDGVEQKIAYFWEDSRPISVGFLVDDSDYMSVNHKMDDLRDALPTFLKSKKAEDEYFVFQFSTGPRMTVSYTTDAKLAPTNFRTLDDVADTLIPDTALYDAIYIGLESIKESANPRKALLVITAGGDKGCDGSKINQTMKPDQLLAFAMKQPVQIYSMMITDDWGTANAGMPCEQIPKDASNLGDLASATGGHDYLASNSQGGVDAIATEIARALKTQFLIGYKSTNTAKDGKRRGVKVKVNPPEGSPKLKVWTKSAYYAPKEKAPKTSN